MTSEEAEKLLRSMLIVNHKERDAVEMACEALEKMDKIEPFTDPEQRIFLKAMSREERVCRKVDKEVDGSISLTHVCHEIERKVKGALWT